MKNKLYIFLILAVSLFVILSFSSFAAVDNSEGFTLTFTNDESITSTQFSGLAYYEEDTASIAGNTPSRTIPNIYRVSLNSSAPGTTFYYNDLRLSGLHFNFYLLGDTTIRINDGNIYISGPALSIDVDSTNLTFDVASGWACSSGYVLNLSGSFAVNNNESQYISLGYGMAGPDEMNTLSDTIVFGGQVVLGQPLTPGSSYLYTTDSLSIIVGGFTSNTFDSDILSFCSWLSVYGTLEGSEEPPVEPPVTPPSGSGGALDSILALFLAVSSWLGQALGAIIPMFWTGSELTLIGVLSVSGLAVSVSFLLLALISRFISFGR